MSRTVREELQEDLLKDTKNNSDPCGENACRNSPQDQHTGVGQGETARKGLEYNNEDSWKKCEPGEETHQDSEGHPLPAASVDLLDGECRRKEGGGEKEDIEKNP